VRWKTVSKMSGCDRKRSVTNSGQTEVTVSEIVCSAVLKN